MTFNKSQLWRVVALFAFLMAMGTSAAFGQVAIYTSNHDGSITDMNIYPGKPSVYLSGGPVKKCPAGLADGEWYFQVTIPSSNTLLSEDPPSNRRVTISGGVMTAHSGTHAYELNTQGLSTGNCGINVQLIPFASSPNGEYKLSLYKNNDKIEFDSTGLIIKGDQKSDNFKVRDLPPPPPDGIIRTEVDVVSATFGAGTEPVTGLQLPVVVWDEDTEEYELINTAVVESLIQIPGWSATVKDKAIAYGQLAPTGTVGFNLYSDDVCGTLFASKGTAVGGWDETSIGSGIWVSDYSNEFEFHTAGAWSFKITYTGSDYQEDGGCEAWPIPAILHTEVDVTTYSVGGTPYPQTAPGIPVVKWNGSSYYVEVATVSSVTSQPFWQVTVKDRGLMTGNGTAPKGHVHFTLYNNDQCTVNAQQGWAKIVGGESDSANGDWTAVISIPGEFASGPSAAFAFGYLTPYPSGNFAFKGEYVPDSSNPDFPGFSDLGCEAWPIPTVTTDIKIYPSGASKLNGDVTVGDRIYDTATVDPNVPGSIDFYLFETKDCQGTLPDAVNKPLVAGVATSDYLDLLHSGYYSYAAVFHSADGLLPVTFDNTCENVRVHRKALGITKTAVPSFDWTVAKTFNGTSPINGTVGGSNTLNYTITVTESGWKVTGKITLTNPNTEVVSATLTDTLTPNCVYNSPVNVPAASNLGDGTLDVDYTCTFSAAPAKTGTNSASASWADFDQTASAGPATAGYTFPTLTVYDSFNGGTGSTLGTIDVNESPKTFPYSTSVPTPAKETPCVDYKNKGYTDATHSSEVTVKVCNSGARTMGFWQGPNGVALIKGATSTGGKCDVGISLYQYKPFQESPLSTAAYTCDAVNTYVAKVIGAASGSKMETMLKAQMLATALDVYFSTNTSTFVKTFNFNSALPNLCVNLTAIPGTYPNTTAAFPGASATCTTANAKTVLELLTNASTASPAGGGATWYSSNKVNQEKAKNTFDAINNEIAPIVP